MGHPNPLWSENWSACLDRLQRHDEVPGFGRTGTSWSVFFVVISPPMSMWFSTTNQGKPFVLLIYKPIRSHQGRPQSCSQLLKPSASAGPQRALMYTRLPRFSSAKDGEKPQVSYSCPGYDRALQPCFTCQMKVFGTKKPAGSSKSKLGGSMELSRTVRVPPLPPSAMGPRSLLFWTQCQPWLRACNVQATSS